MTHLGTLDGDGHLVAEGADDAPVQYTIEVWQEASGLKSADGRMSADPRVLGRAFANEIFELRLVDGAAVRAFVTHLGEDGADIQITGPATWLDAAPSAGRYFPCALR